MPIELEEMRVLKKEHKEQQQTSKDSVKLSVDGFCCEKSVDETVVLNIIPCFYCTGILTALKRASLLCHSEINIRHLINF
jgi:hypothetical protein